MTEREQIMHRLQEHYDYADQHYPNYVLGVFAKGSMNYGFYIPDERDVDSYALIVPSFQSIAKNYKPASGTWPIRSYLWQTEALAR